jgi:hypothetical protein
VRFWLSFADPARPKGSQFLGLCIVHGHDQHDALTAASIRGLNPGGEVAFIEIDEEVAARLSEPLPEWRLLPPDEAKAFADRVAAEIAS